MWPHQNDQRYRIDGVPETRQHRQPAHPPIETPMSSSEMHSSADPLFLARQNHEHPQTSMHPCQQAHEHHQHPHHQQHHQHQHHHLQSHNLYQHPTDQQRSFHLDQEQQRQHHQQQRCDQPMAQTASSNPRASRNMAEKQRRDNLNTNISNMATLVPTVAGSPRRLDKISILRLAATYLRTEYALGPGNGSFLPRKFNKVDLEKFLFETLVQNDGFMLVVTSTGKIIYIGRQVEQYLGHAQADLLGQSLYTFVHPDDHEELTRNFALNDSTNHRLMLTECSASEEHSNSSEDSRSVRSNELLFGEERRSFNLRVSQRAASRREHVQYESLHISGLLRPAEACRNLASDSEKAKRHLEMNATSNDIIFVGIARMMKRRITELSLLEANKEEYVTRHLVDGRIIFCDHRISIVAGYMTHEVSGQNAFSYMHDEDVPWTITALRQMYGQGESFGSSCYRLMAKTGEYIYLRTHAYLEVDRDRQLFESFICVNTSVSKEEGEKLINAMRARYSATIAGTKSFLACEDGSNMSAESPSLVPKVAVKDPLQLENAINHLMSDFVTPPAMESHPSPLPDTQSMKVVFMSQHFPPPAIQASKIGIKCIDRSVPSLNGKDKTIKREASVGSPESIHSRQSDNSNDFEGPRNHGKSHNNVSSSNARRGDKIMPETSVKRDELFHSRPATPNSRYATSDDEYYKIEASPSSSSPVTYDECLSRDTINPDAMKSSVRQINRTTVSSSNRGKPDSMFAHVKTEKIDYGHAVDIIERPNNCTVKRSNLDDSTTSSNKKRRANKNIGTFSTGKATMPLGNHGTPPQYDPSSQGSPFVNFQDERSIDPGTMNCKRENVQGTINGNDNSQRDNDSPCSSLHDLPIDYQPLNPSNVELPGYDDDFPDLLSPGLEDNSDLMQIFDDLGPVIGFEKSLVDRTIQHFPSSDQAVSEGLKRTHMELANRMTMQKNQLCVLEHELETPALQSQFFKPRETLIELRAEHKKNTRMLKTIQQDHHNNMQTNAIKQNIGV